MIQDLIGIPFLRQGRTRDGADCLGLGILALEELGHQAVQDPWEYFLERCEDWMQTSAQWQAGELEPPPGWDRHEWQGDQAAGQVLIAGDLLEHDHEGARGHVTVVAEGGYFLFTGERHGRSFLIPAQRFLAQTAAGIASVWRYSP